MTQLWRRPSEPLLPDAVDSQVPMVPPSASAAAICSARKDALRTRAPRSRYINLAVPHDLGNTSRTAWRQKIFPARWMVVWLFAGASLIVPALTATDFGAPTPDAASTPIYLVQPTRSLEFIWSTAAAAAAAARSIAAVAAPALLVHVLNVVKSARSSRKTAAGSRPKRDSRNWLMCYAVGAPTLADSRRRGVLAMRSPSRRMDTPFLARPRRSRAVAARKASASPSARALQQHGVPPVHPCGASALASLRLAASRETPCSARSSSASSHVRLTRQFRLRQPKNGTSTMLTSPLRSRTPTLVTSSSGARMATRASGGARSAGLRSTMMGALARLGLMESTTSTPLGAACVSSWRRTSSQRSAHSSTSHIMALGCIRALGACISSITSWFHAVTYIASPTLARCAGSSLTATTEPWDACCASLRGSAKSPRRARALLSRGSTFLASGGPPPTTSAAHSRVACSIS